MSTKTTLLFLRIYLREMLRLILKENSFQFNGKHHLQTHSTAMGKKTAVPFANIFIAYIETQILRKQNRQSLNQQFWEKYIDRWEVRKSDIAAFFAQAMVQGRTNTRQSNFNAFLGIMIYNTNLGYLCREDLSLVSL